MKITAFFKRNIIFVIATLVAVVSCFFVPIDRDYLGYFDFRTLTCLFCMLLVICALRDIYFFRILAKKIVKIFRNTRTTITALIFITYFASMLIANDMALITFLPLGIIVLKATHKEKFMIFTFIMQNIAANLGGMLTPFGNPQNLYLYNYFNIATNEFFSIMLLPTIISFVMIIIPCLFIKKEPLELNSSEFEQKLDIKKSIIYFLLFVYSIIIVFRLVPYYTGFLMVPIIFFMDRKAIKQVDYMLLLTFCMFFIFAGNFSRIESIRVFLQTLLNKNTLLTAVVCGQFISNVPSAVLLSNFTTNYAPLLVAVNIGGVGSLVSSLASLITYKQFAAEQPNDTKKYLIFFHLTNFSFLILLTLICSFIY